MNKIGVVANGVKHCSVLVAALLLVFVIGCSDQKPKLKADTKEYNLLFISIDALRADHLGCYGYKRDTSPEIDKFASENIFFKHFFTVVPKTGPSMTSFFTGLYIQHHGVVANALHRLESIPTMTQILPSSFRKAAIVANLGLNKERGYADGFDQYVNLKAGATNMQDQSQAELTPDAIAWLKENSPKGRFFLWLHYLDPHGPYTPPQEYKNLFVGDQWYDQSRKIAVDYVPENSEYENDVLGAVPKYQRLGNHDEADYYVSQYDAEIRYTDTEVKKLFDYLKASNLWDSTIIVLTADHGEGMGENDYYFEHGRFVDDGQIHIPLIIRHPAVNEPLAVNSLLQSTDLGPTILGLYGLKFPGPVDGKDFSKSFLARDSNLKIHDWVYSCTPHEYKDFREAVRTNTGKFVRINESRYQYFDMESDPKEQHDASASLSSVDRDNKMNIFSEFGKQTAKRGKDIKLPSKTVKALKTLGYTQ